MEKGLNNSDILRFGHFNDNQIFFIQRWLEVLNSNTHGRYSIKFLNSHQSLREVVSICEGIINGDIKQNDIHIQLAIEEARSIVDKDKLFERESNTYYKIVARCLQSVPKATQTPKLYSIIYQLRYVIEHLDTFYLEWIVERLKLLLFDNDYTCKKEMKNLDEINNLILNLVSELLGKGWSVKRLYELIKEDLLQQQDDTQKWDKFISSIMKEVETYTCIFRFKSLPKQTLQEKMIQLNLDLLYGRSILETYSDSQLSSHISSGQPYLRVIISAYDQHSAINSAWFQIAEKLNVLRFYGYSIPEISKAAIVIGPDGKTFSRNIQVSLLSGIKKFKAPDILIDRIRDQLNKSDEVSINRKIKSLFEFNRISEESLSPQSAFLNLWIALESFVQTKEREGGIDNVKMVVGTTTSYNYIYSLVKNFVEDCDRCMLEINLEKGKIIKIGKLNVYEAIAFF